jgi:hypothetical protein
LDRICGGRFGGGHSSSIGQDCIGLTSHDLGFWTLGIRFYCVEFNESEWIAEVFMGVDILFRDGIGGTFCLLVCIVAAYQCCSIYIVGLFDSVVDRIVEGSKWKSCVEAILDWRLCCVGRCIFDG